MHHWKPPIRRYWRNILSSFYSKYHWLACIKKITTHPWSQTKSRQNDKSSAIMNCYSCNENQVTHEYYQKINTSQESVYNPSFYNRGGGAPFGCNKRYNGRSSGRYGRGKDGYCQQNSKFKRICNSCVIANHHANSCHFLLKLCKSLSYLDTDSNSLQQQNIFQR